MSALQESIPKSEIYHGYDSDSDSSKKPNHKTSIPYVFLLGKVAINKGDGTLFGKYIPQPLRPVSPASCSTGDRNLLSLKC